jgi:hypothetical protein
MPHETSWRRQALGWARLVAWTLLLALVAAPWAGLGGLVDERLRWLARVALGGGVLAGLVAGGFARDACRPGGGFTHARWLRRAGWPALALTAMALVVCEALGQPDAGAVCLLAGLSSSAGFDVALAAWPLACGRDYRFDASIDFDDGGDTDAEPPTRRATF